MLSDLKHLAKSKEHILEFKSGRSDTQLLKNQCLNVIHILLVQLSAVKCILLVHSSVVKCILLFYLSAVKCILDGEAVIFASSLLLCFCLNFC